MGNRYEMYELGRALFAERDRHRRILAVSQPTQDTPEAQASAAREAEITAEIQKLGGWDEDTQTGYDEVKARYDELYATETDAECLDCGGSGERVVNARWPSGTEPYSEKCPACSGMGVVGEGE